MALVLDGLHNLFMVLPTSFGKSLLYQVIVAPPHKFTINRHPRGGNVLVITPFTALLVDQANKSGALGIPAYNWQDRQALGPVSSTNWLIFIQPESFISAGFSNISFLFL